jgi:FlaA1/EpsC-like NDP-sugar epimerase
MDWRVLPGLPCHRLGTHCLPDRWLQVGIRLFFWIGLRDNLARIATESVFTLAKGGRTGAKRLLIIGAGDSGEKIFREIQDNARLKYTVVGFIDDEEEKVGKQIHGVTVLGTTRELQKISERMKADELLVAIPSASAAQMRAIFSLCEGTGLPSKTIPGIGELIDGKVSVKAIRDVAYNDLLGRPVVRLEEDRIGAYLENSRVLVTGAGGSIGSELCRQICRFRPERLVLYERAESPLYEIALELRGNFPYVHIFSVLGDIRDRMQLSKAFELHQPKAVFHAAAYKHVPMMELQPWSSEKQHCLDPQCH